MSIDVIVLQFSEMAVVLKFPYLLSLALFPLYMHDAAAKTASAGCDWLSDNVLVLYLIREHQTRKKCLGLVDLTS